MKINSKIKKLFVILLSAVMLLTGCDSGVEESGEPQKDVEATDDIQIGIAFDSFLIERWERDRDIFVSRARELGATVNVQNANGDVEQQKTQIEYFIKKGMDVIVIIPIDPEAIVDTVKKAQDAGIKVIAYDRPIPKAGADVYISFDNEKVGIHCP